MAFLFGPGRRCGRTNASLRRLLALLTQAGIDVSHWFTDYWWAYYDELPVSIHQIGNDQTQSIKHKYRSETRLDLRTRIKRLARRTISFLKSVLMNDVVTGLLINHHFF